MRKSIGILSVALLAWLGIYLAVVAREIHRQSTIEEARPADVILVLGAAEYRGRPSPVFKARLDHALELYRRGLAPWVLTSGGAGGDPLFTEGGVGRSYLVGNGVPSEAIIVEPEAETTVQSMTAVAEIMRRMGLRTCILVSDGYHIFRAKQMLATQGFRVYGSPRPDPSAEGARQWWRYARLSVGYLLWRVGIRV
jgi:uncharacterized SAM-binding protein YcdF (DUF218 family)